MHLEIVLRNRAIIFGESCYARPKNGLYQVGVSIENVYFAKTDVSQHMDIKLLRHYSRGGSLATLQVLEVKNHLRDCETCQGVVAVYEHTTQKKQETQHGLKNTRKNRKQIGCAAGQKNSRRTSYPLT